jgi:uncharacterized protein YcaQ
VETLSLRAARRLALAKAGLLKPGWTRFPTRARGRGVQARKAALEVIRRFGYLQLDTVSIAGARSHALVLLSRLEGMHSALGEELLHPGASLFEYWGHEACWLPAENYGLFEFRRRDFRKSPWLKSIVGKHPGMARDLLKRIADDGPMRSADMDGQGGKGWWNLKPAKRVANALWCTGELAIRERRAFQRTYDLTERVIPAEQLAAPVQEPKALEQLLVLALEGHGWATTGTLAQTWRLRNRKPQLQAALARLVEQGRVTPAALVRADGRKVPGWIGPGDLELAARLDRVRPRADSGVLLSPFDPLLWDRARVKLLFDFEQVLEIFKPAPQRVYGYFCLPVLAGERLVARFDLKADRKAGTLAVLHAHYEGARSARRAPAEVGEAVRTAFARYGEALGLKPVGLRLS